MNSCLVPRYQRCRHLPKKRNPQPQRALLWQRPQIKRKRSKAQVNRSRKRINDRPQSICPKQRSFLLINRRPAQSQRMVALARKRPLKSPILQLRKRHPAVYPGLKMKTLQANHPLLSTTLAKRTNRSGWPSCSITNSTKSLHTTRPLSKATKSSMNAPNVSATITEVSPNYSSISGQPRMALRTYTRNAPYVTWRFAVVVR